MASRHLLILEWVDEFEAEAEAEADTKSTGIRVL